MSTYRPNNPHAAGTFAGDAWETAVEWQHLRRLVLVRSGLLALARLVLRAGRQ